MYVVRKSVEIALVCRFDGSVAERQNGTIELPSKIGREPFANQHIGRAKQLIVQYTIVYESISGSRHQAIAAMCM